MMIVIKDDDDSYDSIFWNLHNLHNDSPILSGRLKTEKIGKLLVLKQALKYGLVLEKVHRVIKFGQRAWLKSYIDLNTELRKNAKSDFEKYFFKIMSNAAFEKTIGNLRKHRENCNNWRKKELFSIRIKLSYNNIMQNSWEIIVFGRVFIYDDISKTFCVFSTLFDEVMNYKYNKDVENDNGCKAMLCIKRKVVFMCK